MKIVNLSFCEIHILDDDLIEVITNEGIEVNDSMVEEYHEFFRRTFRESFAVLVNKVNSYSYRFSALLNIGSVKGLKAVAILHYSKASQESHLVNSIRLKNKLNMQHFFNRDSAIIWLKGSLK